MCQPHAVRFSCVGLLSFPRRIFLLIASTVPFIRLNWPVSSKFLCQSWEKSFSFGNLYVSLSKINKLWLAQEMSSWFNPECSDVKRSAVLGKLPGKKTIFFFKSFQRTTGILTRGVLVRNRYAVLHELKWLRQQECKQSAVTTKTRLKSIQLGPRVGITYPVSPCASYGPCAVTRILLTAPSAH